MLTPSCFRVTEMATVLAGRELQRSLKDVAHGIDVSEAALVCDGLHAVLTFLEAAPSCFNPQTFDKLCRCRFHFLRKDTGEISWTHRYAPREQRNSEWFVQVIEHPGFQFEQRFAIGQL